MNTDVELIEAPEITDTQRRAYDYRQAGYGVFRRIQDAGHQCGGREAG